MVYNTRVDKSEKEPTIITARVPTVDSIVIEINKAGYTASPVACGWAEAKIEVRGAFGPKTPLTPKK